MKYIKRHPSHLAYSEDESGSLPRDIQQCDTSHHTAAPGFKTCYTPGSLVAVRGCVGRAGSMNNQIKEDHMLWTIAVVLIILWMLGLVSGYTMGYFIHILLVVAIIAVLVRVIEGRRPL